MVYLNKNIFIKGIENFKEYYFFALLDKDKQILSKTDNFTNPFSIEDNSLIIKGYNGNITKEKNGTANYLALMSEDEIIFYKEVNVNNNFDFCLDDIKIIFEGIEC